MSFKDRRASRVSRQAKSFVLTHDNPEGHQQLSNITGRIEMTCYYPQHFIDVLISVADFSDVGERGADDHCVGRRDDLLGWSKGATDACGVALHRKSFAGIPGKDPPMVKSATDQ